MDDATFGADEANETKLIHSGTDRNLFLARYDANGALAWAKRAGGNEATVGNVIASLADGTSVVTGRFTGMSTFGPGETGETTLTSGGDNDMFLARYAASGELQWATRAGGESTASGGGVVFLSDGSIVVAGRFAGKATFHGGTANERSVTSNVNVSPNAVCIA
jgi:hypothetical protein